MTNGTDNPARFIRRGTASAGLAKLAAPTAVAALIALCAFFPLASASSAKPQPDASSPQVVYQFGKTDDVSIRQADPNSIRPEWIIGELKPGDSFAGTLLVENLTDNETVRLTLEPVDAAIGEDGEFGIVNPSAGPSGFGGWTVLGVTALSLRPHEIREVPYTVSVPQTTAYGEYAGGISVKLDSGSGDGLLVSTVLTQPAFVTITDNPQPVPKAGNPNSKTSVLSPDNYFFWGSLGVLLLMTAYFVYGILRAKRLALQTATTDEEQ